MSKKVVKKWILFPAYYNIFSKQSLFFFFLFLLFLYILYLHFLSMSLFVWYLFNALSELMGGNGWEGIDGSELMGVN